MINSLVQEIRKLDLLYLKHMIQGNNERAKAIYKDLEKKHKELKNIKSMADL